MSVVSSTAPPHIYMVRSYINLKYIYIYLKRPTILPLWLCYLKIVLCYSSGQKILRILKSVEKLILRKAIFLIWLSELKDGIHNIESNMHHTIRLVNYLQKISIIGRNSKEYHTTKFSCFWHNFTKMAKSFSEMTIHFITKHYIL